MTIKTSRRQSILTLPALLLGACAANGNGPPMDFTFRDGIGRRAAGPMMQMYADAFGYFPSADRQNWWRPSHSVDSFSRLDGILPARVSRSGDAARSWSRTSSETEIEYTGAPIYGIGNFGVSDYMNRNPATGLLVAQDDVIHVERYQYGRSDTHRMTSFSMAKTVIAMMVGIAVADGRIRSLDAPAESYAPSLRGLEYGATPVRHLLTMSSGVQFREVQDGNDDNARLSRATIGQQTAGGAEALAQFNTRIAAPGAWWYYASSETYVLAMVLNAVVGKPIAEYFSERIWRPIGAEANASWLIDRSGLEVGYLGLQATVRDYARLGMLMARSGRAGQQSVIPSEWVTEMTRMHVGPGRATSDFGYGYQTWIFPQNDGSFALLGTNGQAIFVHPGSRLVMVHTAVRTNRRDFAGTAETMGFWRSVRTRLG